MAKAAGAISIFEFEDFRAFIQARVQELASGAQKISLRAFCKRAGFASPGLYHYVVRGQRPLTPDAAKKFAKGLGLSKAETEFFLVLIAFQQASQAEEKVTFYKKLLSFKSFREAHPLSQAQFEYYTRWYYPVIREMVGLKNFKESPAWIASRVRPAIHPEDAERALARLQVLGLIGRNEAGKLVQTNPRVATESVVPSQLVSQFHREMLRLAQESLKSFESSERDVSGITLALGASRREALRKRLQDFQAEIFAEFGESEESDLQIFQLSLQLFPLTAES